MLLKLLQFADAVIFQNAMWQTGEIMYTIGHNAFVIFSEVFIEIQEKNVIAAGVEYLKNLWILLLEEDCLDTMH